MIEGHLFRKIDFGKIFEAHFIEKMGFDKMFERFFGACEAIGAVIHYQMSIINFSLQHVQN